MGTRLGIRNFRGIQKGIVKLAWPFQFVFSIILAFFGFSRAAEVIEVPEEPTFYTDMYDCPVDAYHKCVEEGSLSHLVKSGKHRKEHLPKLKQIYELIQDQKIDEFKVSPEFELYYYKLREHNKLLIRVIEGDASAETPLIIIERELKRLLESKEDVSVYKVHARMFRAIQTHYQGRSTEGMTVFEFYNDITDMVKEQEQTKREHEKLKRKRKRG